MTTTDKTVLAIVIVCACVLGSYEYWHALEPIRAIASILNTGKA